MSLQEINPLLSQNACKKLFQLCQVWQEHCVLLDTVTRCLQRMQSGSLLSTGPKSASNSLASLANELTDQRQWDCREHPLWLAFEVLQRIKIRPRQFTVAQQLLDNLGEAGLSEKKEHRGAVLQVRLSSGISLCLMNSPPIICPMHAWEASVQWHTATFRSARF
jgi:hypothetical protein